MRISVNPVPFWRKAPNTVRAAATAIYAALLVSLLAVATGAVTLPISGALGVVLSVVVGYVLWDSGTVVLKGGRVGSVVALVFAAALTAYLGTRADSYSVALFAVSVLAVVGLALLFTPASRAYQADSEAFSAKQILGAARKNRAAASATEDTDAQAAEPAAPAPANRQQRRAAQRAQKKNNTSSGKNSRGRR